MSDSRWTESRQGRYIIYDCLVSDPRWAESRQGRYIIYDYLVSDPRWTGSRQGRYVIYDYLVSDPRWTESRQGRYIIYDCLVSDPRWTESRQGRYIISYLLNLPLFAGVSRVRALSPAWTGSHARETLISRTHLFLSHDLPPTKKIKYNKILTYILRSIFLQIPHLELLR